MHTTTYEERRARLICLACIMALSVCVGFVAGRYSALPWTNTVTAVADVKPDRNRASGGEIATSTSVHAKPLEHLASGRTEVSVAPDGKTGESPAKDTQPGEPPKGAKMEKPAEEQIVHGATVVNAGASEGMQRERGAKPLTDRRTAETTARERTAEAAPRERQDASMREATESTETGPERTSGSNPAVDECARRYASFRESDGTYQPYGAAQRKVCPLLRRAM